MVSQPCALGPVWAGGGGVASNADDYFLESVLRLPPCAGPREGRRPRSPHRSARKSRSAATRGPRGAWFLTDGPREPIVEHGRVLRPSRRSGPEPIGPAAPGRAPHLHLRRPGAIASEDDPVRDDGDSGGSGNHGLAPQG